MSWSSGTCDHCESVCETYSYKDESGYYCSYKCQDIAKRTCSICCIPFSKSESGSLDFCSKECSNVWFKRYMYSPKHCEVCRMELPYDHPLEDFYGADVFYACSKKCKENFFQDNPPNWEAWKT